MLSLTAKSVHNITSACQYSQMFCAKKSSAKFSWALPSAARIINIRNLSKSRFFSQEHAKISAISTDMADSRI